MACEKSLARQLRLLPGMTITYALIQMVEKISERSDLARIINKAFEGQSRCGQAMVDMNQFRQSMVSTSK